MSKAKKKSYWKSVLKGMFDSQSLPELFTTRAGRAAVIHNFMRGLSLEQTYPLSPFTPFNERVKEGDQFDGIFDMHPTHVKHIYMVDAGLTFNSPYPLVLRPQRHVDVILSFDFSGREHDSTQPFKELLLAEKWARLNRLAFPPINVDLEAVARDGVQELYVFQNPQDPRCPVILHFALVNNKFRHYKAPGVPRETQEERDFANFDIFDDPATPYSTFNFTYTHDQFQRLSQLTEFNTLLSLPKVKQVLAEVIARKREAPPRTYNTTLLRSVSRRRKKQFRESLKRMESRAKMSPPTPSPTSGPPTPFFTPQVSSASVSSPVNPFVFTNHLPGESPSSSSSPASEFQSPASSSGQRSGGSVSDANPFFRAARQDSGRNYDKTPTPSPSPGARADFFAFPLSPSGVSSPLVAGARRQDSVSRSPRIPRGKTSRTPRRTNSGRVLPSPGVSPKSSLGWTQPPSSSTPTPASYVRSIPQDLLDQNSPTPTPTGGVYSLSSRTDLQNHPDSRVNPFFNRIISRSSSIRSPGSATPSPLTSPMTAAKHSAYLGVDAPDAAVSRQDSRASQASSNASEDEFHDAAAAFRRDGTAVHDEREAKMHSDGAKQRRRLLRRQSTISSLSSSIVTSISLDSEVLPEQEDPDRSFNQDGRLSPSSSVCSDHIDVADLDQFEGIDDLVEDSVSNDVDDVDGDEIPFNSAHRGSNASIIEQEVAWNQPEVEMQ